MQIQRTFWLVMVWTWVTMLQAADESAFTPQQIEFFEKEVRPLLVEHCQKCHGSEKQKGELRLDSREALIQGGESGPAIVIGKPQEGELIKALKYDPDGYQMPPDGKLADEKIAIFSKWVEMGAPWPAMAAPGRDRLAPTGAEEFQRRSQRYAFQPLQRALPPQVQNAAWSRTPLDRFVLAPMEAAGKRPPPEADKRTWIRRVYLDVVGLPPRPEVVEAFVADESPDAQERLVDELLASPRFGERWGRHWLDLVRYAESRGHEFDYDVANPWHYRDYVIQAINDDLPYNQFVVEHLAGDLQEGQQSDSHHPALATGFWYFGEWIHSPVEIRKEETERVDNMLDVFGKSFLGLTLGCARCHDHKFDPITSKDYYALAGYVQSTSYAQRPYETLAHNRRIQEQLRTLQSQALEPLRQTYQAGAARMLASLNLYLLAARELLARSGDSLDAQSAQVFDDFEAGTYAGWEATGDAFGSGPQSQKTIGSYQGNVHAHGDGFINSHQLRDGGRGDDHVGTLTSREFPIQHDTLRFLIGGGHHPGQTGMELLIDGKAVLSVTGHNSNQMRSESWDLRPFRGKTARLRVMDQVRGGWGNIGIDHLVFRNQATTLRVDAATQSIADQLAKRNSLDPSLVVAWAQHALTAVEQPTDPFHTWARFAVGRTSAIETVSSASLADLSQAISLPVLAQDGVYYSLPDSAQGERVWLSSNPEAPVALAADTSSTTLVDPDFAAYHEREGSMKDVGALGGLNRAGRTLRTVRFTIQKPKIGVWVRGGCATYVVVDSHALINGPLHGSIVRSHEDKAEWHWIEHDVSRYVGHQASIEIVAKSGPGFACDGVYQLDAIPAGPKSRPQHLLSLDPLKPLPTDALAWIGQHPQLFGLDRPAFRQQVAAIAGPLIERRRAMLSEIRHESAVAPVMLEGSAANEQVMVRGNPNKTTGEAPRRFIEVFHGRGPDAAETGSGRLDLAKQMVDPGQTPLLPRVIVNRLWHHYFGRGIVATVDDFGHMGELPTNPELLDWLATELVRENWSLKQIHRQILLSAAYRMEAREAGDPTQAIDSPGAKSDTAIDSSTGQPAAANYEPLTLKPRRLEGEIIRDCLLALSGRMDDRLYGPSIPVALNPFQDGRGRPASGPVDGAGRRSVYLSIRRNFADSFLTAFDLPNAHTTMGRRNVSNVPAQALALLNSPMVIEQTRLWGARLCRDTAGQTTQARVDQLYRETFARLPTEEERASALTFIRECAAETKLPEDAPQLWGDLCHVLVNTKEFYYVR